MKKTVCIIFVLLLTLPAALITGCAEKSPSAATTDSLSTEQAATVPEDTVVSDDLPERDYDGKTFRVLIQQEAEIDFRTEDHETGKSVHDAVLLRNNNVKDRFGIEFEIIADTYTAVNSRIKTSVKSGSDDYDLCFVHMVSGAALAQSGELLPFEKLSYVDLSKPWWDKAVKNGFSIRNNLMMVNGDISPFSFSITSCLYFNKTMFDRLDLTYPYGLVTEGKWTLDRLYELTKGVTADKDGDGVVSPTSTSDVYGLSSWHLDVPYSLYYAAGGMLVSKDDEDVPFYDPQAERDSGIYSKIYNVIIKNNAFYATDMSNYDYVTKMFTDGRALFLDSTLNAADSMRDMDDEFGIVPVPMLNENQKEYRSFVNGASSMVCVPATAIGSDLEYLSIVIEGIASESYRVVTPELKETYLKRKITRDAESAEMIDFVVRNRVFDMGYVNLYDGAGSFVRELLGKKATDISSTMETYKTKSAKKIQNIVKAFDKSLAKSGK